MSGAKYERASGEYAVMNEGVTLDANREVRVKLYMGQVRNQPITIICIKQKF